MMRCRVWTYQIIVGAIAVSSAGAKERIDTCLKEFPELLSRVDAELKPWIETGITRQMLDNLWRCDNGDPERYPEDVNVRRFAGLKAIVRSEVVQVEKAVHIQAKMHMTRGETIESMLNAVNSKFKLPDVELMMSTMDHLQQAYLRDDPSKVLGSASSVWPKAFGAYSPDRAPLMVAYRLQMDSGTVAVPDWTFPRFPTYPAVLPEMDEAAQRIAASAQQKPWFNRSSLLFFVGQNHGGAQRRQTYELAVKSAKTDAKWGLIGGAGYGHMRERVAPLLPRHTLEDHCQYKYLLHLAGNGGSARLKYLFFCNSTVVAPVRAGGLAGAGPGNEFEEFFFHRLKDGDNCFRPKTVFELPDLIHRLQPRTRTSSSTSSRASSTGSANPIEQENLASGDALAQAVASRGAAWASKELTQRAAHCYWAYVIDRIAALEKQGQALPPRPNNSDGPRGTHEVDPWWPTKTTGGEKEGDAEEEIGGNWTEEGRGGAFGRRKLGPPPGPRAYDCCKCHDSVEFLRQRGV